MASNVRRLRARGGGEAGAGSELCALIIQALRHLGGEAHRSQVIERILTVSRPGADREALSLALLAAFERAAGDPSKPGVPFGRRLGPGSHRWTLGSAPADLPARRAAKT